MTTDTLPLSPSNPAGLIRLLTQQRDLYVQLKSLSDQQAALIAGGETERLLGLLAQRQRMVDALTRLNRDLAGYRKQMPDLQADLPLADRERVRALMDEVDELLHAIIEQDDRDRRQLQAAQKQVGAQLSHAARGGAAMQAYRAAPRSVDPRFTDRQG